MSRLRFTISISGDSVDFESTLTHLEPLEIAKQRRAGNSDLASRVSLLVKKQHKNGLTHSEWGELHYFANGLKKEAPSVGGLSTGASRISNLPKSFPALSARDQEILARYYFHLSGLAESRIPPKSNQDYQFLKEINGQLPVISTWAIAFLNLKVFVKVNSLEEALVVRQRFRTKCTRRLNPRFKPRPKGFYPYPLRG